MRPYPHLLLMLALSFVLLDISVSDSGPISHPTIRFSVKEIFPKIKEWFKASGIGQVFKTLWADLTRQQAPITRGTKLDGLGKIKVFLDLLGYVNPVLGLIDDVFDVAFELAVKSYQTTYSLNSTGALDFDTLQHMSYPRCGVADIVNNKTTINTVDPNHWWIEGKTEFTYGFLPNTSMLNGIADDDIRALIKDAFSKWSNITMLNFTESKYNVSDIVIVFTELDGKGAVVGGSDGNSTVHFGYFYVDKEEQWVLPGENKTEEAIDLESVVIHQIGHLLGLEHSTAEDSVMYPSILPSNESKLNFADNDIERIQKLYPRPSSPPSPAPAPASQGHSSPTTASGGVGLGCRGLVTVLSIGFAFVVLFY
ncbi:hypothetical protein L6164_027193 [Bauhinia variegata]|uniref:Uncharacterized protein n=1 Tax=Bauhinia variegata TaxID=167791 RepID=A0ACB9LS60_BAUVA|nr:hypothetical protein L6164_027193 [Bauhinia variegata]